MSKIDYEITVDVSNEDVETKKQMQDAFFKLGITWWDGDKHVCLDKGCYTNTSNRGKVTQDLMWADESTEPTHTIEELLELAGMRNEAILKPFDLEKALAGDLVETIGGLEVYELLLLETVEDNYPLVASVEGKFMRFTKDGEINKGSRRGQASLHDLKMAPKTRKSLRDL